MKINPVATAFNKPSNSKQAFGCGGCVANIETMVKKGTQRAAASTWHSNRMTSEINHLTQNGIKNGGVHNKAADNLAEEIKNMSGDFIALLNRSAEKLSGR